MSAAAAEAAYSALPDGSPGWEAALLAGQVGQAHFLAGSLWSAMEWCERAWVRARGALRETEGFPTFEIMEAYDRAAVTMARLYLRLEAPSEIRRLLDDLAAIHAHAREMLREFNETSLIPLQVPAGDVRPEQLAGGRIAAILALAEGEVARVAALAEEKTDPVAARELQLLALHAYVAAGRRESALALLERARGEAREADASAAECEVLVLSARLEPDAGARLAQADEGLRRAAAAGLGLCWRDLMIERARALQSLGRSGEACSAAEQALDGSEGLAGAHAAQDWAVAREAVALLREAGRTVANDLLADLERHSLPPRSLSRRPDARRTKASGVGGPAAREDYHAAALRVIQAYETEGTPFILYLRKFGIDVLHGPFDQGPKLTENQLRDAMPANVEVVTVQDPGDPIALESSRFVREAPALGLSHAAWASVVDSLIGCADLIVSEALILGEGVRAELEMVFERGRWDRTVLLLPPLDSPLSLLDSDPLIQAFPRCVWADELHRESFTDSAMVVDLVDRIRAISALAPEERRLLVARDARDAAFPVDMLKVAANLETMTRIASAFDDDDRRTRYYAFWRMFRAAGIRGVRYGKGDRSPENRTPLANLYLEMSAIMLDHEREGDRFILLGDPADALRLVQSALHLVGGGDDILALHYRRRAEDRLDELARLDQVMEADPERFEIRPLYGPLRLQAES